MLTVYFEKYLLFWNTYNFPVEFLKENVLSPMPLNMRLRPVVFGTDAFSSLS